MKKIESKPILLIRKDLITDSKKLPEKPFLIRIRLDKDEYFNMEVSLEEAKYLKSELEQEINDHLKKIRTFKINSFLKLKLESGTTNIYVGGKRFDQCKYLLLNIPTDYINKYDNIKSIDEASERLDHGLEGYHQPFGITPDMEFKGHCSNIQAWYENDYDTRLLHRNIAFPLLRKLSEVGDKLAQRRFKEEIALRIESEEPNVLYYLIKRKYLDVFSEEEVKIIYENLSDPISKWLLEAHKKRDKIFLDKYNPMIKSFLFRDKKVLVCNSNNCDRTLFHDYPKDLEFSIFEKIKCKLIQNKKFLDFGIQKGDTKIVYPLKSIRFGRRLLKDKEDILIAIPKEPAPIRLHSPSQNLYVFIKYSEIIL